METSSGADTDAALRSTGAGARAIRGGVMRTTGYAAGTLLATAASVVLLRYLGLIDIGHYVTVMSLLAVVSGLTDAGLTTIGQREYALARTEDERRRLLADLVALRLVLTPAGVLAATAFALAAGYDRTLVLGTVVGGIGVIMLNVAATLTVPLSVQLRLGAVTTVELARQVITAAGLVALAAAGASLLPFFAVNILTGIGALTLGLALVGASGRVAPRFAPREWWPLLVESAPVALALVINVLYVRILVILMSLLASETEIGNFATSFRIIEVFLMVPLLIVGSAFPLLSVAGGEDADRLAYALSRLGEAVLALALALAIALGLGAAPIVDLLGGGSEYDGAVPVLQIQCAGLIGAFLTQVWIAGLIAIRRQRALVVTNVAGLATVLALGLTLIPALDARGAAIAAVVGETVLATVTLGMLLRARPSLRPRAGIMLRLLAAAAAGALAGLAAGLPDALEALAGCAVFVGLAFALRAVPLELVHAFRPRRA